MKRAVFLDRDGTLIVEKEFLHKPEQVEFYPGAPEALNRLQDAGFLLIIVTNQSGVGRGYFSMNDVEKTHDRLIQMLSEYGVRIAKIFVAPEAPGEAGCGRKPGPQFLFDARDEFAIDLSQSYMIGDKLSDLECGWNAGVKQSVLVRTGYGRIEEKSLPRKRADLWIQDTLADAAEMILNNSRYPHDRE